MVICFTGDTTRFKPLYIDTLRMPLSPRDLESKEIGALDHLGEARLGSDDTVAPIPFMEFDEKGKPREIRGTILVRDLIGNVQSIGASALTSAAYKGMTLEDRLIVKGVLETSDEGAIKLLAESQAHELAHNSFRTCLRAEAPSDWMGII
jgi:hypothetical protein